MEHLCVCFLLCRLGIKIPAWGWELGAGGRGLGAGGWQIAQSGKCLPEFSPQSPHTKLSVVVHSCNPNAGKWEAGDPWNVLASQLLIREPQVKVRASLKNKNKLGSGGI